MPRLKEHLPPVEQLEDIPAPELAMHLLQFLKQEYGDDYFNKGNVVQAAERNNAGLPDRNTGHELKRYLMEAFQWLEREMLIAEQPGQRSSGWFFITRRGQSVDEETDHETYQKANFLPKKVLDPALVQKVHPLFLRGDYDTAVFKAFRMVEVRMRDAAGLSDELVGMKLARKAFDDQGGPLTDMDAESGEREALQELVAGAMGYFKNPTSHREVDHEAIAATESIMFANHLLRIISERSEESMPSPSPLMTP